MRVEVYRNLRNGLMSVREVGGVVLTHEHEVFIKSPRFVVQPAGRAKVIREKRKNVHAFVRGELLGFSLGHLKDFDNYHHWNQATYNPYLFDSFVDKATQSKLDYQHYAVVTTQGVYYA